MSIHAVLNPYADLPFSEVRASEDLTTPGTPSTIEGKQGEIWTITAKADCYVEFGTAPDGAGNRWFLSKGDCRQLHVKFPGEKVAYALT